MQLTKYGLVLEGGGAKGSYQIGAYQALQELGYEFEAVVGTSIGAINGAFIVSGEVDKCKDMWRTLNMSEFDEPELKAFDDNDDILTIIANAIKIFKNGNISPEPLKRLVYNNFEEDKIRESKMRFGLATLNVTDRKAEDVFADEIEEGLLLDYIVGSAYLPFFKMEKLHGKYFLDGGMYNRIPFNMVVDMGLVPLIIRANPKDLRDRNFPKDAIVIEPSTKINNVLNFNTQRADKLIQMGYMDAIKKLKNLSGDEYYFEKFTEAEALEIFEAKVMPGLDRPKEEGQVSSPYRLLFDKYLPMVEENLQLDYDYHLTDALVALVEKYMTKKNLDKFKTYKIKDIAEQMQEADFYPSRW